jgi:hypothetical protein
VASLDTCIAPLNLVSMLGSARRDSNSLVHIVVASDYE